MNDLVKRILILAPFSIGVPLYLNIRQLEDSLRSTIWEGLAFMLIVFTLLAIMDYKGKQK